MRRAGLQHVRLLQTKGPRPAVYADWLGAEGRPTVLIYGAQGLGCPSVVTLRLALAARPRVWLALVPAAWPPPPHPTPTHTYTHPDPQTPNPPTHTYKAQSTAATANAHAAFLPPRPSALRCAAGGRERRRLDQPAL